METTKPVRIIFERDIPAEVESRVAALELSHTKRPNCTTGCYNLVFETNCGHAYTVRKRCGPYGSLVCTGTEIITLHISCEDTTLILKRGSCVSCHLEQKSRNRSSIYNDMTQRKRHVHHSKFKPKHAAARARADAVKEVWRRKCHDERLAVHGLSCAQLAALEDEGSGSSQRSQDPQASTSSADKQSGLEEIIREQPAPEITST